MIRTQADIKKDPMASFWQNLKRLDMHLEAGLQMKNMWTQLRKSTR